MFLESLRRDHTVGMIMTGLGGEGNRLRYFIMIRSGDGVPFTNAQEGTIERAFSSICNRYDSVLEDIQVHQAYATMKALIPLDVAVGEVIEGGIGECNTLSDFLDANYYVTNDKIPTEAELLDYLQEMGMSGK